MFFPFFFLSPPFFRVRRETARFSFFSFPVKRRTRPIKRAGIFILPLPSPFFDRMLSTHRRSSFPLFMKFIYRRSGVRKSIHSPPSLPSSSIGRGVHFPRKTGGSNGKNLLPPPLCAGASFSLSEMQGKVRSNPFFPPLPPSFNFPPLFSLELGNKDELGSLPPPLAARPSVASERT